jgi:beta-lactamase superfamily II metal-dependent hydrolase
VRSRSVVNVDLADVWETPERKRLLRTLAWGDEVTVVGKTDSAIEIETVTFAAQADGSVQPTPVRAFIVPRKPVKVADTVVPRSRNAVLKVNFVDVQQGDGAVIESPAGKVILVDGGDNQLFARYLASRFRGTSLEKPQVVEAILVTHGDADHFVGLPEILASEKNRDPRKRLFIRPKRILHNGLVKRPTTRAGKSVPDRELLGKTVEMGGVTFIVGLEEDLLKVPDAEMNAPFRKWKATLATYDARSKLKWKRVEFGDDRAFDFFNTDAIRIDALGPLATNVNGKPALRFLGTPPSGPRIGHEALSTDDEGFGGLSASHTINGHSIVFRLSYGAFSYLFCGDLNDEASRFLAREHAAGTVDLRSDVFKVPHHGSADFSGAFLQSVAPVVSVVSSGDESARKEFIHPRATLMGALGKYSRVAEPLVFVTELVAFFNVEGWSRLTDAKKAKQRGDFFGFSRTAFGMVKTRTDGKRLLVTTDSGNLALKEAYAYRLDESGVPTPAPVLRA